MTRKPFDVPVLGHELAEMLDAELVTRFDARLAEYTAKGLAKEDVAIVFSLVCLDMGTRIAKASGASVLDVKERVFQVFRDFDLSDVKEGRPQ